MNDTNSRQQPKGSIFRSSIAWAVTAALALAAAGWLVLYAWVILVTLD